MSFDTFISYSHQNKAVADAACVALEAAGIRCWMAPRDVAPGSNWAGSIVEAIGQCRMMVLIFSSSANLSKQIHREVQHAFEREIPVVPFRIENIAPERSLAYYLSSVHWLDALTPPLERHLQRLVQSIKGIQVARDATSPSLNNRAESTDSTKTTASRPHPPESTTTRAQLIAQYLPFLRRYARALTGSQQIGDPFVGAVVGAFARDIQIIDDKQLRVMMYAMFSNLWNALSRGIRLPEVPDIAPVARIASLPRQAFLLTSLEGFSEEEVAEILCLDKHRVLSLVGDAGRELARGTSAKVLIIEDEDFIAIDLMAIVESLRHTLVGVARTASEAVELSRRFPPDLILADVQLADGSSGLDAVNDISRGTKLPVIFLTAYPERFLTGLRPEPAFLVAKPFQPAMISAVISQALFLADSRT